MSTHSFCDSTQQEKMASSEDLNWAMKNPQPVCSVVTVNKDECILLQTRFPDKLTYSKKEIQTKWLQQSKSISINRKHTLQNKNLKQTTISTLKQFYISYQYQFQRMCIPQIKPSTEKALKYVFFLKFIFVLQLVISALNLSINTYFVKIGIFGIFLSFCLFLSQRMLYYPLLLVNILIGFYFACEFLCAFLIYFQNGTNISQSDSSIKYTFAINVLSLLFYSLTTVFYYYPYVQFKMISYKQNPGLAHIFQSQTRSQEGNNRNEVPFTVNYGQIKVIEGKKNNNNGIFEISRGQGIKI